MPRAMRARRAVLIPIAARGEWRAYSRACHRSREASLAVRCVRGILADLMLLGGRYQLVSLAGKGGMAEVWRGESLGAAGFRRSVAIKRVHTHMLNSEHLREMFIEEARVTSMLDHPNIVQVYDFGQEQDAFYLVMEWVEGMTLRDFIDANTASGVETSPEVYGAIGIEVLHALDAAHTHVTRRSDGTTQAFPIIHRDVSPSNVLLSVRGIVKLADFGFARAFDRSQMTPAGIVKGKIAYLAPEQARGAPASERTDLYSCGIMLWEMICQRRLHEGKSQRSIAKALIRPEPHPRVCDVRPSVPAALGAVIDRALAIDPDERYPSASEFSRALKDALRLIPERTDATRIAVEVAAARARFEAMPRDDDDSAMTSRPAAPVASMPPPPPPQAFSQARPPAAPIAAEPPQQADNFSYPIISIEGGGDGGKH
jgi:serine/threonine protein kinase